MSTPTYKGPGQPMPSATSGITGWLGGFLGGAVTPAYKTTPTAQPPATPPPATPTVQTAPACPLCPTSKVEQTGDGSACVALPLDLERGDAVIPVGPGPITIVINPRA